MTDSNESIGGTGQITSLRALPRDLWRGIEAGLPVSGSALQPGNGRGRSSNGLRKSWMRVAAVAAAAMVLGIGVWIWRGMATPDRRTADGVVAPLPMLLRTANIVDARYLRERAELLQGIPGKIAALPPESQAKVTASLATIHKAMRDIEAALGHDSSNALLQELLINTCQDEMRVLTAVQEATEAAERT